MGRVEAEGNSYFYELTYYSEAETNLLLYFPFTGLRFSDKQHYLFNTVN